MFGKWLSISICSGPVVLKEGAWREGGREGGLEQPTITGIKHMTLFEGVTTVSQ